MDDPRTTHAPRSRDASGALAGRLLVVVPPFLRSRVSYFTGMLAGSGIDIIIDRRHAERRRGSGRRTQERRRRNRRGPHHLVGYLYGCSIVRVGESTSS